MYIGSYRRQLVNETDIIFKLLLRSLHSFIPHISLPIRAGIRKSFQTSHYYVSSGHSQKCMQHFMRPDELWLTLPLQVHVQVGVLDFVSRESRYCLASMHIRFMRSAPDLLYWNSLGRLESVFADTLRKNLSTM